MKFIDLQRTVYNALKGVAGEFAFESTALFKDIGFQSSAIETSVDPDKNGYAVIVWPPFRGNGVVEEQAGINQVETTVVVRFEVNPAWLSKSFGETQDGSDAASDWILNRLKSIAQAVLSIPIEPNGLRFSLAQDAFDLANFDDSLVAYHIRFIRQVVF
jgi:hypothetical protein